MCHVYGVNKGPLETARACTTEESIKTRLDYTRLYQKVGVTSVRLHDDAVDLSVIFKKGKFSACQLEQDVGFVDPSRVSRAIGVEAKYDKGNYTCESYDSYCYKTDEDSGAFLAWDIPRIFGKVTEDASNYDFSLADQSYQSVVDGGFEVYLRLGDSWNGTALYSNRTAVSEVGGAVLAHYLSGKTASERPSFIELHNEPDGRFWQDETRYFIDYLGKLSTQVRAALGAANGGGLSAHGINGPHRVQVTAKCGEWDL